MKTLPPLILQEHDKFLVVRDDLIDGGTKRRVLNRLFPRFQEKEIVCASTPYGYGQLALAFACRDFGKKAKIFQYNPGHFTEFYHKASDLGASIEVFKRGAFEDIQTIAREYASKSSERLFLSSSFDEDFFIAELVAVVRDANVFPPPQEVWCVAGRGVLTRALQKVWPDAEHHVVRIRTDCSLYGSDCDAGNARIYSAPEAFRDEARYPPPFKSAAHYDAKLWQFAKKHASAGALIWNM